MYGLDLTRLLLPQKKIIVIENCGDGCLFNIKSDPTDHINLATKMPDVHKFVHTYQGPGVDDVQYEGYSREREVRRDHGY